jgi:hypothetical protein
MSTTSEPSDTSTKRVAWAGLIVAVVALAVAGWQGCVAQRTYDRAAGKVLAKVSIEGVEPSPDEMGPEYKAKGMNGMVEAIRFNTLERLMAMHPAIVVKNTGDEPIRAVRVETRFVFGMIDYTDEPAKARGDPSPWAVKQFEQENHELSRSLQPGQYAHVPITRGLLKQMIQAQDPKRIEKVHYGRFDVSCYGSLVGMGTFDQSDQNTPMTLSFSWLPSGFPDAKTRKFLDDFLPSIEITDERKLKQ